MKSDKIKCESEPMDIRIADIVRAKWNTHLKSKLGDEAFVGLKQSLQEVGMLHRVVVRYVGSGEYGHDKFEIVDGHRRFDAAVSLGWEVVPCEMYTEMTDDEARARTLTANIQRIGNDPLLEADCIELMRKNGKNYEQIAATLGKDARYVARRARICNLTEKWRGWLARMDADASVMEMIASHEQTLQDEVYDGLGIDEEGEIDEDEIRRSFRRRLRKIGQDTPFDIGDAGCMTCLYNTATHGYLFDIEPDSAGRCQKDSCFTQHCNDAVDQKIANLRKKKIVVKQARCSWNVPHSWSVKNHKTTTNTEPWVYEEEGLKRLVWAEPDGDRGATRHTEALTEEEKAKNRRIAKAHSEWSKNRKSGIEKIREAMKDEDGRKRIVDEVVSSATFHKTMVDRFRDGIETWTSDGDCLLVWRCVGDDFLNSVGAEMTAEEINALVNDDPAEIGEDGEKQDA